MDGMPVRVGACAVALVAALMVAASGCTEPSKLYCDLETPCTDASIPFCDLEGTFQARENRCIQNPFGPCEVATDCPVAAPLCDEFAGCIPCTLDTDDGDAACAERDPAAATCNGDGRCIGCTGDSDCDPSNPICSPNSLTCVACTPGAAGDVACTVRGGDEKVCDPLGRCVECARDSHCPQSDRAFCGDDGTCRGCIDNLECPTGVCKRDLGVCALEEEIARDPTETPSADIQYIKYSNGVWDQPVGLANRHVIGSGSTIFTGSNINMMNTYLEDVIVMSTVLHTGPGYLWQVDFIDTKVVVIESRFERCRWSDGSLLHGERDTQVYDSQFVGDAFVDKGSGTFVRTSFIGPGVFVESNMEFLVLDRCEIRGSQAASAILLTGADYEIRNTIVVDNAGAGITVAEAPPSYGIIELTTVANNSGDGVICAPGSWPASSSIVYGNAGTQVAGGCIWEHSDIEGGFAGTGNIDADPKFAAPVQGDFHLSPESPCIDGGDDDLVSTADVDGDPRPLGASIDMGADEFVP